MSQPHAVLVLGMHRSGTSALARVINLLGVDLGPDLMRPKPGVNDRGFWESEAIVALHDRLLDVLDVAWSDTRPLPPQWWQRTDVVGIRDEITQLLRARFADAKWWGQKDPRLCRLLPLWRAILAELATEPLCIGIVRNPLEVAASLARRDGIDAPHAHLLWLEHVLEADAHSRGLRRVFVHYEALLADWRACLRGAAERLGVAWPVAFDAAAAEIDAFLAADLRHHVASRSQLEADAELSPWVLETYRALERLIAEGESPEALARLDAVRAELARAELHYGPVASRSHALMRAREAELAGVRRELEERENDLTRLRFEYDARLAEAKQRIDEVTTALERAQEEATDSLQHALDEANANREWALTQQAEIERLRGIIELRNARIDEYVGEVGRRGVDRARLQRDLEAEQRQLASLEQHAERLAHRLGEAQQRADTATAETETAWRRAREQTHLLNEALRERDGLAREVARLEGEVESGKRELARASQRPLAWSRRVRDAWSRLTSARASRGAHARPAETPALAAPAVEAGAAAVASPAAEPASQPLSIPSADTPLVSIVIPVFDQFEYTIRCLRALAEHAGEVPFETIVVDDGSSDETRTLALRVQGVRVERSDENRGFVDACNRGAAAARGDLLVFLNNDTEVRAGWLDGLVACFRGHRDVGAVGAKLLSADGRLQEAGGLIWSDGSGWNLGRDDHPERPEWQFVREVDYCSAACLLVPRRLFESLGGFDRRYAPAYYEDVDLCFAIRRAGLRVLYQPRAEVVHFEGATSGRDVAQGAKRHQVTNQITFCEKWADELARQPAPGSDPVRARARGRRRVLVIDARTPMADNDAGSLRMLRLLRLLFDLRCHVAFSPEIPVYGGHYTQALQQAGVEVLYDADPSTDTLARYIQEQGGGFDVVLLSRFYVAHNWMPLVREHCPHARVVLDTVDLHFVRERREAVVQGRGETDEMLAVIREQEIAAARAADLTIVVSEVERQTLLAEASDLAIEVLPTIHDAEPEGPGFWEREGLVYVGSFQHKPNGDAIQWYASEIEPLVQRALPGLVLTVIGSDVPPEVLALASPTLRFVGRQPDLAPSFRAARLSIAPLRFGAGVKGKINTSMSFGVPVVTTPIGAEGLEARDGEELVVAADAASFARAIVELYADPARWERLARAGRAAVERNFSFGVAERALRRIVDLSEETPPPAAVAAATTDRERRLEREIERYREVENVHDLPAIYHFWSNRYLLPMLQGCEIRGVDEFFLDAIAAACRRNPEAVAEVASIGAGNCDLEVRLARALCDQGLRNFSIHCIEINPHMIERGKALALAERVAEHLRFEQTEVSGWQPERPLAVCMANHSLHHIEELELLFDRVKQAIDPDGVFVINDMIGRNGHMRWPEALERVRELWRDMPDRYKHNRLLQRFEAEYQDWDCSQDGNEGIRAQDILPLLLERFHFETFVGFANVIDVFIDRAFGHNFDPASEEDRAFIDRVALLDEQWIDDGLVKPTHMIAALRSRPVGRTVAWKHWTPEFSVRYP